jgi:nucleoside-diphosphate-sugar epimerase
MNACCRSVLKYENQHEAEIWSHNVVGTRNMLELTRRSQAEVFNHVSTAYVAGKRDGLIAEEFITPGTPTNNYYEASKLAAEQFVAHSGLYSRILRPSIVIGHSRTLAATNFTGFYGFIRGLVAFQRASKLRGLDLSRHALRLRDLRDSTPNLIPVDRVASEAVSISGSDDQARESTNRIYHLTNPNPLRLDNALYRLFYLLGWRHPRFVESTEHMYTAEQALDRKVEFYAPYMRHAKTFSRRNTDRAVGFVEDRWRLDDVALDRHIHWYLKHLQVQRPIPSTCSPALAAF